LLLHVVDAADADREAHIVAVERILNDLDLASTPRLLVYNKIDRLTPDERAGLAAVRRLSPSAPATPRAPDPCSPPWKKPWWREGRIAAGDAAGVGCIAIRKPVRLLPAPVHSRNSATGKAGPKGVNHAMSS